MMRRPLLRYWHRRSTSIGLWLCPDSTWQLILRRSKKIAEDAVKLTVLIKDNGVAESIPKLNFHDGWSKRRSIGASDRFECTKSAHTATCNKVNIRDLKTRMGACWIGIHMQHEKRCLDRKIINQLTRTSFGGICQGAAGTCRTHPLDIWIHARPVEIKTEVM